MTVFVTSGNLTIDNDIKYPANYATRASIPRIKFVVMNGDIRIQPNVRQIDAELITLNGTIDTCYTAQANKYDSCSSAKGSSMLLVNGSLQAPTISLNRLVGTLREGTSTDASRSGPGAYANSGNIGEIVQFTPELFFSQPAEPSMTPLGNRYDAITALPPLF
jgi:hypothetical protein